MVSESKGKRIQTTEVMGSALGLGGRFSPGGGLGGLPDPRLGPGQSSSPHTPRFCPGSSQGKPEGAGGQEKRP